MCLLPKTTWNEVGDTRSELRDASSEVRDT